MSEEEDLHFERSQIGHDANDLHTHGGLDEEAHEDKTDRESLEEAIEALDDSNDIEEVKESTEEPVEEEKSEPVEEEEGDREAIVAPTNDWKTKEENQPYMTVDEVVEPKAKKKGGLGWKISTFLFLIIAIAGCGAAAYLFFSNGKTEFLGRRVTSESTDKKEQTSNTGKSGGEIADVKANRVILLDGYDLAIKVPDTLQYLSFDFHYFNEGGCPECTWSSTYSTLDVNAAYTKEDAQAAPEFTSLYDGNLISLGSIVITKSLPQNNDAIGDPTITIETGDPDIKYYVYYDHPQQNVCLEELGLGDCAEWENQTVEAIEAMLTNKDNYIKTK